jgi:transcriptional regulator with XRE-family HTH domain
MKNLGTKLSGLTIQLLAFLGLTATTAMSVAGGISSFEGQYKQLAFAITLVFAQLTIFKVSTCETIVKRSFNGHYVPLKLIQSGLLIVSINYNYRFFNDNSIITFLLCVLVDTSVIKFVTLAADMRSMRTEVNQSAYSLFGMVVYNLLANFRLKQLAKYKVNHEKLTAANPKVSQLELAEKVNSKVSQLELAEKVNPKVSQLELAEVNPGEKLTLVNPKVSQVNPKTKVTRVNLATYAPTGLARVSLEKKVNPKVSQLELAEKVSQVNPKVSQLELAEKVNPGEKLAEKVSLVQDFVNRLTPGEILKSGEIKDAFGLTKNEWAKISKNLIGIEAVGTKLKKT